MSGRVVALLVALPLLMTGAAVGRMVANRGGEREPIVLSELEVTVGQRGSETSGRRVWLNVSTQPVPPPPREARGLRRRTYVALRLDPSITGQSRLTVVDRNDDPEVLATRYPHGQTHIITAATVTADGYVQRVDPSGLVVPRELAARLPVSSGTRPAFGVEEPYFVTLRYGRHWEPWVVDAGRR